MKQLLNLLRTNNLVPRAPLTVVKNEATGEHVFYLYDVIYDGDGWGVSAMDVIRALTQAGPGGTLRMRIKSPGGDVMEASRRGVDLVCAAAALVTPLAQETAQRHGVRIVRETSIEQGARAR